MSFSHSWVGVKAIDELRPENATPPVGGDGDSQFGLVSLAAHVASTLLTTLPGESFNVSVSGHYPQSDGEKGSVGVSVSAV